MLLLYGILEKCPLSTSQVMLIGNVVSTQGIHVDDCEIKTTQEWSFSIKGPTFEWNEAAHSGPPWRKRKRKSKLMPRSHILEKIGPMAYKVDLPEKYGVSATLNGVDLSLYYEESEKLLSLRSNSHQAGENDEYLPTKDHKHVVRIKRGPRNRTKVKKKEQNMSRQLSILPGQTFSHEPGFVKLVEDDPCLLYTSDAADE